MELKQSQASTILYDLAMTMAGETQPRPLATKALQRLLAHTGCSCGAVLLGLQPPAGGGALTAEVYVALGHRALRALEGQRAEWPGNLRVGELIAWLRDAKNTARGS